MNFPVRAVWKMNFLVIRWFSNLIALGEKIQALQKEVSNASALVPLAAGLAFLSNPLQYISNGIWMTCTKTFQDNPTSHIQNNTQRCAACGLIEQPQVISVYYV